MIRLPRIALFLAAIALSCSGADGSKRFGALAVRTDVVSSLACGSRMSCSRASGPVTVTNIAVADWAIGNTRWYALDGDAGSDANAGYSDSSAAAAGLVAVATDAQLNAILPVNGAGRNVVVLVKSRAAAGTYGALTSWTQGRYGYRTFLARATVTDSTAGSTAFLDDTTDRTMAGGVILTGTETAGYHPTGSPTTRAIQFVKVTNGLTPGWAAEPALPAGARLRWDAATTTTALRGIKRTILKVTGGNIVEVNKLLPAVPAAGDTAYVDMPGVLYGQVVFAGGSTRTEGVGSNYSIVGFQTTSATSGARGFGITGNAAAAFCWHNASAGLFNLTHGSLILNSVYPANATTATTTDTGGACRSAASMTISAFEIFSTVTGNSPFIQGTLGMARGAAAEVMAGFVAGAGMTFDKISNVATTDADPDAIGTTAAQTSSGVRDSRIIGPGTDSGLYIGSPSQIHALEIINMGALPAVYVAAAGITVMIVGPLSGSTGNTGVCLDLTNSYASTIVLRSTPTCTGSTADVRMGGGTGTKSWATLVSAGATGTTDANGNKVIYAP